MARPHICFIQAQSLRWRAVPASAGLRFKTLSLDAIDGAATRIVELEPDTEVALVPLLEALAQADALSDAGPVGAAVPSPERGPARPAGACLEWLVLDGELELEDRRFLRHGYGFIPQIAPAARMRSAPRARATLLLMNSPCTAHAREAVFVGDSFERPWQFGAEGSVTGKPLGAGIASKILRRDPVTGELAFLYCAMPQHPPPRIMVGKFTHPVIEEIFVLDGTYVFGDVGRMGPGGYAFWREGEWHGPAGSESGYHLFIRALGGPLSNQFSSEPAPFEWHPAYRPALPEPLRALASPWSGSPRW